MITLRYQAMAAEHRSAVALFLFGFILASSLLAGFRAIFAMVGFGSYMEQIRPIGIAGFPRVGLRRCQIVRTSTGERRLSA
jgi:hypothetical protein